MSNMYGLSIENHTIDGNRSLSKDLADHMRNRYNYGRIAVASNNPVALLSSVRKQWLRLIRLAERERASTLDHRRKYELGQVIWRMRNISFTAQNPADDPVAFISFATVEQFRLFPPMCSTLYVIGSAEKIDQHMLTSWMPRNSRVVVYG
jgi:hypothetical protein